MRPRLGACRAQHPESTQMLFDRGLVFWHDSAGKGHPGTLGFILRTARPEVSTLPDSWHLHPKWESLTSADRSSSPPTRLSSLRPLPYSPPAPESSRPFPQASPGASIAAPPSPAPAASGILQTHRQTDSPRQSPSETAIA